MKDLTLNLDPETRQEIAELLRVAADAQRETAAGLTRERGSRAAAEALRSRAGRANELAEWFEAAESVTVEIDMEAADDSEQPAEEAEQRATLSAADWLKQAAEDTAEMEGEEC